MQETAYKTPYIALARTTTEAKPGWEKICLFYGTRITRSRSCSEARSDLYVVPDKKIFLLLACSLSSTSENTSNEAVSDLYIRTDKDSGGLLRTYNGVNPGTAADYSNNSNLAFNYAIPMVLIQGEVISVETVEVGTDASASIFGYEIDSELFYKNI